MKIKYLVFPNDQMIRIQYKEYDLEPIKVNLGRLTREQLEDFTLRYIEDTVDWCELPVAEEGES